MIRKWLKIIFFCSTPGILVLSFIGIMHIVAGLTNLPGYRGGPQDAFRHTLASAYVAKYISPEAVKLLTKMSEHNQTSESDRMDIHNNTIGMRVGMKEENLYLKVSELVSKGQVNTSDAEVITWMPKDHWKNFLE